MENKKLELLKEICNWYNYNLVIAGEKIIDSNNTEKCEYQSLNDGLKDWLITLEESNKSCIEDGIELLWSNEEIELIKSLKE